MPTVTAADEALSSCSKNAAYSPTIMAAQIRSAKAQAESGNPAMVTVRRTLCTRVTATRPFSREANGMRPRDILIDGAVAQTAPLDQHVCIYMAGIISNEFPSPMKEFPVWPVYQLKWLFPNVWRCAVALRTQPRMSPSAVAKLIT